MNSVSRWSEVYETATFYHHFDVLEDGAAPPPEITIRTCDSIACDLAGAQDLIKDLKTRFGDTVRVLAAPCMGACDRAPVAAVGQNQVFAATPDRMSRRRWRAKATSPAIPGHIDYDTYLLEGGYSDTEGVPVGAPHAERPYFHGRNSPNSAGWEAPGFRPGANGGSSPASRSRA